MKSTTHTLPSYPVLGAGERVRAFQDLGYGMFLHYGLFSILGRGEWALHFEKMPMAEYEALFDSFDAGNFSGRDIARLAKESGMRYAVLTTRHHDGFSLYDTRGLSDFDAPHSPAGRDLVADFVTGCRQESIVPFFYHTTLDWRWGSHTCSTERFGDYMDYLCASLETLCTQYGPVGGFWFDGNWSRTDVDWQEDRFYGIIRRHQPDAIIINNTGLGARGAVGHPELDSVTFEQDVPHLRPTAQRPLAAEACLTINSHWGHTPVDFDFKSTSEIIRTLAECRRVSANLLLNVGPLGDGTIPELETAILRRVGGWVRMHEKALFGNRPSAAICEGRDFVLRDHSGGYYFAFDLDVTGSEHVVPGARGNQVPRAYDALEFSPCAVRWTDNEESLPFVHDPASGLGALRLSGFPYGTDLVVRVARMDASRP